MSRLIAIALYVSVQCISIGAMAQNQKQVPSITVNSTSTVSAQPDKVIITAGIETSDHDINVAKSENAAIFEKAMAAIELSGVSKENVRTAQLLVAPRWDTSFGVPSREQRFLGYFVNNTLVITLSDISALEELTTQLLVAGVNYIHDVNFESSQLESFRDTARAQALQAALDKAQKMAATLGAKVGRVISIREGHYDEWSTRGYGRQGGMGGGGGNQFDRNFAMGDLTIGATIVVEFELKR